MASCNRVVSALRPRSPIVGTGRRPIGQDPVGGPLAQEPRGLLKIVFSLYIDPLMGIFLDQGLDLLSIVMFT